MKLSTCMNASHGALQPCHMAGSQSSPMAAGHPALSWGVPVCSWPIRAPFPFLPAALRCCPGVRGGRTVLGIWCCCTPSSTHRGIMIGHRVHLPSEQMPQAAGHGWGEWDASVGVDGSCSLKVAWQESSDWHQRVAMQRLRWGFCLVVRAMVLSWPRSVCAVSPRCTDTQQWVGPRAGQWYWGSPAWACWQVARKMA